MYYQFRYHCCDRFFTVGCSSTVVSLSTLAGAPDPVAFVGPGVRYHGVLYMAPLPGDLDIRGLCRLARASHADLDISLVISIAEVWGPWRLERLLARQNFGGLGEQEEISFHDIINTFAKIGG